MGIINCAFLLILIFTSPTLVSSLNKEIVVDYPKKVKLNEKFIVNITLINFYGIYDVKIETLHNKKRIGKIYNSEKWRSTYYYIKKAINTSLSNSSIFILKIEEYVENVKLNITIRESGKGKRYSYGPYLIKVVKDKSKINELEEKQKNTKKIIILNNPKDIKRLKISRYISKFGYVKEYGLYFTTLFCIFVIFYALKKS